MIIPAILTNSQKDLKNKLKQVTGLTDWVQIDIMDGKFVKNTSISLADLKKVKTPFNLEIHLMVLNPEKYFSGCQKLKAKRVIFHFESTKNLAGVLREMGKHKFEKGMAINPKTSIEKIKSFLNNLDLVLLLGVAPGFQSQKFSPVVLRKIKKLRKISKKIKIEVNGGVNLSNIQKIAKAGADYLVVGSGLFRTKDVRKTYQLLKCKIKSF